ncbi:hypothetical protein [Thalassovita mangrovi]|uniref:Uncharacterized protein n=1 Tax=Thalassovita mangrovi TaxID=2692236 RepID=A0A6L8LRU6_9RHOB|nr:hypothetical protein [Thalassovita mangrovi]MYM55879.1 hypothetical protein [Thalassovita mangrovi]
MKTSVRTGPGFFLFPALIVLAFCALIAGARQGNAMGSPNSSTIIDVALPGGWAGVEGAVARDDGSALTPGQMRLYRVVGDGAGLPGSIQQQAALIRRLAEDLPPLDPLTDISARAEERGAGITALSLAAYGSGKYTRPNRILAIGAGSDRPGFVLVRIAEDAPDAPVAASFYCLGSGGTIALSHLAGVRPEKMIEIKDVICREGFK